MTEVIPPTTDEIYEEDGITSVSREVDDSWRHGAYITEVFHRTSDDTYWKSTYRLSTDGETHGLRDGEESVYQVKPVSRTVVITDYVQI